MESHSTHRRGNALPSLNHSIIARTNSRVIMYLPSASTESFGPAYALSTSHPPTETRQLEVNKSMEYLTSLPSLMISRHRSTGFFSSSTSIAYHVLTSEHALLTWGNSGKATFSNSTRRSNFCVESSCCLTRPL